MKAQQQTLSVRISDAMRRRLEGAQRLISRTNGAAVSISDVAKRFLESAQDDRIEAGDLLAEPTETLINIRRKWERGLSLSRAEWQVMGYYLQEGCEHITEGPELPSAESFVDLTKAFIAALGVRDGAKNLFELDHYYLGNLGDPAEADEKAINAESVIKLSRRWVDRINEARANGTRRPTPGFIGRNLYVVFRDERLRGVQPLNEVLRPYMRTLFRVAARGHYLREKRPVRERDTVQLTGILPPQPPPVVLGDLRLSIHIQETMEFSVLLNFAPQRVLYPLDTYPVICEFDRMVKALSSGEQFWRGREFFGYTGRGEAAFNFRRNSNGITLDFSPDEWTAVSDLTSMGLALPELQPAREDSELAYGEI
jgi:hypothetical protein